jgi:hypothetical protein
MAVSYGQTQGFDIPSWTYQNQEPFDIVGSIERGIGLGNLVMQQPNLKRGRQIQKMQQQQVLSGDLPITQAQTDTLGLVQGTMQDKPSYEAGLVAQQALTQQRQAEAQKAQMEAQLVGQPEPLSPVDQARINYIQAQEDAVRQSMGLKEAQAGMMPQAGIQPQIPIYDEAGNLVEQESGPFFVATDPITGQQVTMMPGPGGRPIPYKAPVDPFEQTLGRELAKTEQKVLQEDVQGAEKAYGDLPKLYEMKKIVDSGQLDTGMGADIFNNFRRVRSLGENIISQGQAQGKDQTLINNELMDAFMGQNVFPMIGALGIGARGLDTPAEREFILSVFSGRRTMDPETIKRITQIAIDMNERRIDRYNQKVQEGRYRRAEDVLGRQMPTYDYVGLRPPQTMEQQTQQTQPATPGGLRNAPTTQAGGKKIKVVAGKRYEDTGSGLKLIQ